MNIASSDEWSTGCESGWTHYLDDQSYISTNTHHNVDHHHQTYRLKSTVYNDYNDHDEDLSMVSDASSGPPHFLQNQKKDEHPSYYTQKISKKSRKNEKKKVGFNKNKQQYDHHHHHPFCKSNHHLDDTASSPSFSNSQENSSYNNHYAFWQSSQVNDANEPSKPSQWFEGGWQQ
ncbi:unnamed protein product [Amaranthus hypochondriacus]